MDISPLHSYPSAPPVSIAVYLQLLSLFQIQAPLQITEFLDKNPGLYILLISAAESLCSHHNNPQLLLSLGYFSDIDAEDYGVWVDVKVEVKENQPENFLWLAQQTFDTEWWYPKQLENSLTKLINFSVSSSVPGEVYAV